MHQVDLHEARLHLAALIAAALSGDEVIITQDNQPVLKLVRISASPLRRRKAGSAKGLITMTSDFDAPLEDFRAYTE